MDDVQLKLRIPAVLKQTIAQKAAINKRSLNAEVIDCLEKIIAFDKRTSSKMEYSFNELTKEICKSALLFAEREFTLSTLHPNEKKLIEKLNTLPKNDKEKTIKCIHYNLKFKVT